MHDKLMRAMLRGHIEPVQVKSLISRFDQGWDDGRNADLPERLKIDDKGLEFRAVAPIGDGHEVLTASLFQRGEARRRAGALVSEKRCRATVISFSLTRWPRSVRYSEKGYWLHTGGRLRRKVAYGEGFGWCSFASCVAQEIRRVAKVRGLKDAGMSLEMGLTTRDRQ